jgi:hypothetical protein
MELVPGKIIWTGQYDLKIVNASGQVVYTRNVMHSGGSASRLIPIPAQLRAGIYSAEIRGADMRIYKKLIIK